MPANSSKTTISKFPLRLMPSVRRTAEAFSQREGVSLNQFINVAVAEKLAHLEHDEWLRNRSKVSEGSIAKALAVLDNSNANEPQAGDELPDGYRSVRGEHEALSATEHGA